MNIYSCKKRPSRLIAHELFNLESLAFSFRCVRLTTSEHLAESPAMRCKHIDTVNGGYHNTIVYIYIYICYFFIIRRAYR